MFWKILFSGKLRALFQLIFSLFDSKFLEENEPEVRDFVQKIKKERAEPFKFGQPEFEATKAITPVILKKGGLVPTVNSMRQTEADLKDYIEKSKAGQEPELPDIGKRLIILKTGQTISLEQWQRLKGYKEGQIAEFFWLKESGFNKNPEAFEYSELVLKVADEYRRRRGHPVRINSAYRTQAQQKRLREKGYKAAIVSPHCEGMALDIDTNGKDDTASGVILLRQISKDLGIGIRIGWRQYLNIGQTFIHIDVCPEYYGKDRPYYAPKQNPSQWEVAGSEW